jgi:protein disulfide-isomerase-like protein
MFYAPWCGHCKLLDPTWNKLAEKMASEEEEVIVGKVDVTQNESSRRLFDVQAFPTLILFTEGNMYTYRSSRDRTLEALFDYVRGDYRVEEATPIPNPPNVLLERLERFRRTFHSNRMVRSLLHDLDHILRLRKNAALLLLSIGLMIGFSLGLSLRSSRTATNSTTTTTSTTSSHECTTTTTANDPSRMSSTTEKEKIS